MSAPTADALEQALRPLREDPAAAAVLCDIDGTLAPIVERADDAHVPEEAALLLSRLARRYGCVACVSGRSAAEARRLVGVGGIAYAGSHGAELLPPGAGSAQVMPAFQSWERRVRRFAGERTHELRLLRVRIEDKGPITAFHWRGVPDEEAARTHLEGVAQEAEGGGLATHWGRKVLEVRPPVPISKGRAVRELVTSSGVRTALFGGDDATDLDAFDALAALGEEGVLDASVCVGVRSDEGPAAIVERADLVVDGVDGFTRVLAALDAA
ncbi:MAG: trehalose-phosphatase [Thermoleophilaceae bacterium]|nr:trehalose-phosphatase [Thermoleophilaceae bacterium]